LNSQLLITLNTIRTVEINGYPVRISVREHFNKEELGAIQTLYPAIKRYISKEILMKSLDYFENVEGLDKSEERIYAHVLALFQRIKLPLEYCFFQMTMTKNIYIISEVLPNFKVFNNKFKSVYDELFYFKSNSDRAGYESLVPINIRDQKNANPSSLYTKVYRLLLRLWLAGYGLTNELSLEPITAETLKRYFEEWHNNSFTRNSEVRLLNSLLVPLEGSPVQNLIDYKNQRTIDDKHKDKWNKHEVAFQSEIYDELKTFTFGVLLERTQRPYELEYEDIESNNRTEILPIMSMGTWRDKADASFDIVKRLNIKGYTNVDEVISDGIQEVLIDIKEEARSRIDISKTFLREWLNYYSKKNKLIIKVNKIIPNKIGRGDIRYGKTINFSAACELIETLMDDQSPFVNDNQIAQFRGRRALLLMLETAARAHEICLLKQNCIKTNRYGEKFLYLHKTKTGKPRTAYVSKEALKWVSQSIEVAYNEKILISKEHYSFGDDQKALRVFANYLNDGPMTPYALNAYLYGLQRKMWGNQPKGGRFFSSHDLRRMCAVYFKIKGYSDEEIKDKLGQENIASQIPYLLTKPKSHLQHFKNIYDQGLWSNDQQEENEISNSIYNQISSELDNEKDMELSRSLIESFSEKFNDIDLPADSYLPENEAAGGYPLRTHNCKAKAVVTCHHTEIKCFGCGYYDPDSDKLVDHKAEILRWIIFLHVNTTLKKETKNKFEKHKIAARVYEVEKDLNATFENLFTKFNLNKQEVSMIEKELYTKAKKYISKYGKVKSAPDFKEALEYYKKGVLNG
jgi:integrase